MSKFIEDEVSSPNAFIQWKGTDVCLDFSCLCGASGHFDGYFAYVIKCPECEREWEMPCLLQPRENKRPAEHGGVVVMEISDE